MQGRSSLNRSRPLRRLSHILLLLAGTFLAQHAGAATVYVSYPPSGFDTSTSSVSSTGSLNGSSWIASADLASGIFRASYTGVPPGATGVPGAAAGILGGDPLTITVNSASTTPLTGYAIANVSGAFQVSWSGPNGGGSSARVNTQLSLSTGGVTSVAGAFQRVARQFDTSGNIVSEQVDYTPTETSGGSVSALSTESSLAAQLLVPFSVAPGDSLSLLFFLDVTGASTVGVGEADFAHTATLSLLVNPDAVFTTNATVPLTWITTVPLPGALPLILPGLGVLLAVGFRRQRAAPDTGGHRV